jgi:hypothetical protein
MFLSSKRRQRICFFSSVFLFLAIIVPTATLLNAQGINNRPSTENHIYDASVDVLTVAINITSLQTTSLTTNLHFNIQTAKFPFTLSVNSESKDISATQFNPQADLGMAITQSSSSRYPFDQYLVDGNFVIRNADGNVRVYVYIDAAIDSWYLLRSEVNDITDLGFENYIQIRLNYRRGYVVILFAIFVGVLVSIRFVSLL